MLCVQGCRHNTGKVLESPTVGRGPSFKTALSFCTTTTTTDCVCCRLFKGTFLVGTEACPYQGNVKIVLDYDGTVPPGIPVECTNQGIPTLLAVSGGHLELASDMGNSVRTAVRPSQ